MDRQGVLLVKFLFRGQLSSLMSQHVMCQHTSFRECVLFEDCLISYVLATCLCSFCTEIDIATYLKVSNQLGTQASIGIFDCHNASHSSIRSISSFVGFFGWDLQILLIAHVYLPCYQHINLMKLLRCSYIYLVISSYFQ